MPRPKYSLAKPVRWFRPLRLPIAKLNLPRDLRGDLYYTVLPIEPCNNSATRA